MDNVKKSSYKTSELMEMELDFSHENIIQNLKEDCDDFIKIFSIINLDKINSIDEAHLLFAYLTDNPTPLREAVSLKLDEIYDCKYFDDFIKTRILRAIIDINPNVSRAICALIEKHDFLKFELIDDILLKIKDLLVEINKSDNELGGFYFNAQKIRKNHAKNKKLFSLYWYLESLSCCFVEKNNSVVLEILNETIKFNDYTIREKTAKILTKFEIMPPELLKIAKNDENFYVKNQVYDKINFED